MKKFIQTTAIAALLFALPVAAQENGNGSGGASKPDSTTKVKETAPAPTSTVSFAPAIEIQYMRANDKRGINVFETPKEAGTTYDGFKLNFGAAFTQQFQGLGHSNTAAPKVTNNVNANQLIDIGHGFNNASANLFVNAQLAPGIRVALTSYLSSRHHNETWVKDGYLLIDESPFDVPALKNVMKYVTIKAGHFEVNYGDAHLRRSDNGNAMYNPFVGNLIMDAFTTEVGGEVYLRANGFLTKTQTYVSALCIDIDRRSWRCPFQWLPIRACRSQGHTRPSHEPTAYRTVPKYVGGHRVWTI
jgi:hypothetical protein